MRFEKTRALTEIEDIRSSFPNYDTTPLRAEYSTDGKILFIETDDNDLRTLLISKGFTQR